MVPKECSDLDVEFLNEWSRYRRALADLRRGDAHATGRAKASHLKLLALLDLGRSKGCRVQAWEAYDGGRWEGKIDGRLPF